jgi:hypothetical protein
MCFRSNIKSHSITWEENVMKNNSTFYRNIRAVIGFALTIVGISISSRTVEAADVLYIGDGFDNTVKGFDADTGTPIDFGKGNTGIFVTSTNSGTQPGQPIIGPRGLIFNRQGNLVLANQNVGQTQNGTILSYSGTTTAVFLAALVPFTDPNSPVAPRGIVLGGNLFVASQQDEDPATGDGKLRAYTKAGKFVSELAGPPGLVGGSFHPRAVVIGPDGANGPMKEPWYLTFGKTDPSTLAYPAP